MLKDFKKFKKQLKDIKEKISNIRITNNVKLILALIFFVVSMNFKAVSLFVTSSISMILFFIPIIKHGT